MRFFAATLVAAAGLLPVQPSSGSVPVEREAYLMGTRARLLTWDVTRASGLHRLERALDVLEQSESELSTWRLDSDITALNNTAVGRPRRVGARLCSALAVVAEWQRETRGAFDPAIGRLLAAWDVHGSGRLPSTAEIDRARSSSGFEHLTFDSRRCLVTRNADVTIDTGAFGKGEALDRAARVLGDAPWMIDLGGQISVHGAPPDEEGWPVAVAHPFDRDRAVLNVRVRDGSLSTSAGSERDRMVDGTRIGHILDPHAGRPAAFHGAVTVWHRSGLVADILSTALFVMGPAKGLPWAEARGLSACYLVPAANGRVRTLMTSAFQTAVLSSD